MNVCCRHARMHNMQDLTQGTRFSLLQPLPVAGSEIGIVLSRAGLAVGSVNVRPRRARITVARQSFGTSQGSRTAVTSGKSDQKPLCLLLWINSVHETLECQMSIRLINMIAYNHSIRSSDDFSVAVSPRNEPLIVYGSVSLTKRSISMSLVLRPYKIKILYF